MCVSIECFKCVDGCFNAFYGFVGQPGHLIRVGQLAVENEETDEAIGVISRPLAPDASDYGALPKGAPVYLNFEQRTSHW